MADIAQEGSRQKVAAWHAQRTDHVLQPLHEPRSWPRDQLYDPFNRTAPNLEMDIAEVGWSIGMAISLGWLITLRKGSSFASSG